METPAKAAPVKVEFSLAEPATYSDNSTNNNITTPSARQNIEPKTTTPNTKQLPTAGKARRTRQTQWRTLLVPHRDKLRHILRGTVQTNNVYGQYLSNLKELLRHRKSQRAQAIIDLGATGHYGSSEGEMIKITTQLEKVVGLADGTPVAASVVAASVKATLPYPSLPSEAQEGDIIPGCKNDLISVKKLVFFERFA